MELVDSFIFEVYEEGEFANRYPAFQNGIFTYSFNIENSNNESNNYTIQLFPNYWSESADITIFDDSDNAIISNLPFNLSEGINFFQGLIEFNRHKLIYNNKKKQFEIWQID